MPSGLTVGQWERETTFLGFPLIEEYDFNGDGSYFWGQILFLDDLPALFLLESGWYETFDTFPEQIHIHADSTIITDVVNGTEVDEGPHDHYYLMEIVGNRLSFGEAADPERFPASWELASDIFTFSRVTKNESGGYE